MSADDARPRAALKSSLPLPDASERNVILALLAVRVAPKTSKISDRWLKSEHNVRQDKQAVRLLRFLRFVDSRKKLTSEFLASRQSWPQFRSLLMERVREGCHEIGVEPDRIAEFGSGSWDSFQGALQHCTALANRSDRSKDSIVGCFRALADIVEMDEESFEKAALERTSVAAEAKPGQGSEVRRAVPEQEISFPIGRRETGQIVYARLTISEPMQPGDLRRLAEILKTMDVPAEG